MRSRPVSTALIALTFAIAPQASMSEVFKWVEADGSVHYGDTPPQRTKNVRVLGKDSGTLSVVPGMSKEEKERFREREDQLRLQRLEREVEELRARELARDYRDYAEPEIIYSDVYVPAYGYGRRFHHRRDKGHIGSRSDHLIGKPIPPQRTQPMPDLNVGRAPALALSRR